MDALLGFLMTNATLFCIVAIGAMVAAYVVRSKGSLRAIRAAAVITLCACAPLFVLYGLAALRWSDPASLIFAALWGFNAWSSWTTWRNTRPQKQTVRRN